MKELQYLTEKDMDYFRKKAELGEAVIIQLDLPTLLTLDIDMFAAIYPEPSEDEVMQWLSDNSAFLKEIHQNLEEGDKDDTEETQNLEMERRQDNNTLAGRMLQMQLDDEQRHIIADAIESGLSERQILSFLKPDYTTEQMRAIYEVLIN